MGLVSLLSLSLWWGLGSQSAWAGAPSVAPGAPALQFTLPAINENAAMELVNKPTIALSDFAGLEPSYPHKVTIVYFCSRKSGGDGLAALERVARRYRGKDAQIIAVLADSGDLGGLSDWIAGLNLSFPVLRDEHRIVATRYGLSELPITYIIDVSGDVYAVGNPNASDLETEVSAEIEALLQEP